MPSIERFSELTMSLFISADEFSAELRKDREQSAVLVLDCRPTSEFAHSHVTGAINVTLPTLMLRRLSNGKLTVPSVIQSNEGRERFASNWKTHTIVLCGTKEDVSPKTLRISDSSNVLTTLCTRLHQDGCQVRYLEGGYETFSSHYPEWCYFGTTNGSDESPILGLQNLRITCGTDSIPLSLLSESSLDGRTPLSSAGHDDPTFPVEILPYLFLGNAKNSGDLEALERHRIRYIVNVTENLPNRFETEGHIKYMQIPIADHWSENLASYFVKAIAFIEEARDKKQGVLVHCLAGISRSVTITVAYLMHKMRLSLNDAYDLVRTRKADISPNFNFMGQLLDFERQLSLGGNGEGPCCTCQGRPCNCVQTHFLSPVRTTPDSGVDCDLCDNWPPPTAT